MAIVGGFIGGGVEMVPAGHAQIVMQWLTPDRQNIAGASFTLTVVGGAPGGPYTASGGSDGRAEIIVPVADYSVSVTHTGTYANDSPQLVHAESGQSYLCLFGATETDVSTARILFGSDSYVGNDFVIKDSGGLVRYQGTITSSELEVLLSEGSYNLAFAGLSVDFTISEPGVTVVDISASYVSVPIDMSGTPQGTRAYLNGVEIAGSAVPLKKGETSIITFTSPVYAEGKPYATIPDITVEVSGDAHTIVPSATGTVTLFTEDASISMHGTFHAVAIGGGGGGMGITSSSASSPIGGGGGCGGYIQAKELVIDADAVPIVCGAGGAGGAAGDNGNAGGASSLGTYVSASGGAGGATSSRTGGAGGGGGSYGYGGDGTYGGGGGAYSPNLAGKSTYGNPGDGNTGGSANLPAIVISMGFTNGSGGKGGNNSGGGGGLIGNGGSGGVAGGGGGGYGNGGTAGYSSGNPGGIGAGGSGAASDPRHGNPGGRGGNGCVIVKWVSR